MKNKNIFLSLFPFSRADVIFYILVYRINFLDEGVYNTYIIDTDYTEWALIMHCAEKAKSNRYLSALMLSRTPSIGINVINFLRFLFSVFIVHTHHEIVQ